MHYLLLVALGGGAGALGTLIGAGGGFILVPILLLLYPHESALTISSISLAVVLFNATSGSWAYARMGRVDYRSGLVFAAATVPGAVAGALTVDYVPRLAFNAIFGVLMIVVAGYLFTRRKERTQLRRSPRARLTVRTVVEKGGATYTYAYDRRWGVGLSVFVGYLSSLLGIGGGIIHVPALVRVLHFPVHIATATSQFILAIMAFAGTAVHIATGSFSPESAFRILALGMGAVAGAQGGARFSTRVRGVWLLRGLAVALALVGVRILTMAFGA
ncbi:MAG: hypothetical protein BIP78_0066 [Candidatus Bipolaricaulis sibiricus]|uniref:Probable membrane transporter protein n=1 Tax=Bipolaricaulis sibiricus TaxID=2501609 RepID=A0A410FS82_BIPS1|nr:MAG: hypothetical protein BIP78_0066 [Candidatus Bipolaricaulis sibiricus]